ncbi:restriction endonuclease subunit S [Pseudoalteromonas sp. C8]|uniref:restriction endonuclease subunit S n=1 Tax=Pseudoalteromonas sp. C8 TaxID=2686345 RepID=UPI001F0EE90C|nr:restriction endonuclease subunit S [Pseudoalteromonas sp. C8]
MVWEIVKLGELCRIELGKTPSRSNKNYWDESKVNNNIWLSIADLPLSDKSIMLDSKEYISNAGAELCKIVPKGTLIVSFKLSLGRLAVTGRDLYTNEAIAALYIHDKQKIDQNYLSWYLTFFDWDAAAGSDIKVKGKTLNKAKLKEIEIVVPPILEQKRIVTILDQAFSDIEQARAKTEQNLKNARELMNVAYHDAITGKLTSVWREANQTVVTASDLLKQLKAKKKELVNEKKISREKALPELCKEKVSFDLPESWAWCCLGEIGNATNYPFVDGPFGSSINTKTDYLETGVPVLRMVNVKPFMFKNYDLKYVDEDKYQQFTRHNVLPGDVLFSKVGAGTGESCVVPEDFSYGMLSTTGITRIRVGQIVLNQYLCCFLNLNIKKFMALASKAAQPFLNMTQIKTFPFPLPPIEEQSEIVLILERLSAEIQQVEAIYEQKVLALDELKKSILQKAFSGELTKTLEGDKNKGAVA